MARLAALQQRVAGTVAEGFIPGKGSNNWAVGGARSTTGAPILAGDMHLSLSLPSIWYEAHLATPTMNTYGVMAPGTPLPIEAFNDYVGWAFTNTGADVIDHYALELDETGTRYRFEGGWRDLQTVLDTIYVKGGAPVIDTLSYAHWGPVVFGEAGAVATRWVAHEESRTLAAIWGMNHARTLDDFQAALRHWDAPAQNIIYADVAGNIAIRSTGYLPLRNAGHGEGLLDGTGNAFAWTGRVPFDELPHSINPAQGFLTSTNQEPADSTYPHYLGYDWGSAYRSLRIDTLLRGKPKHGVDDFKRYQADVHAVQRDLFVPLLDTLAGLSARADTLRRLLAAWPGETTVDRPEPLVLFELLRALRVLTWDEPVFDGARRPSETVLYSLLRDDPEAVWLDVQTTDAREDASGLLRLALEATADTLATRYGWGTASWRWGDHHQIVFRHLTQTAALRALWRGPFAYPGFAETLSPAGGRPTTHSASWRVIVDFSQTPPVGYGVYAGGQSGNPFSAFYDAQVPAYVQFTHYDLLKPAAPEALEAAVVSSRLTLHP
jgi:penicillin amidase